jgi:hypothetical protein
MFIYPLYLGKENFPYTVVEHPCKVVFYNRDFVGIAVPETDADVLKKIFLLYKDDRASLSIRLFLLATSSSALVSHETAISQNEFLELPLPENAEYLKLSNAEKIIQEDILQYYFHLGKGIKDGKGIILNQNVTQDQLRVFGEVFCETMNTEHDHTEENRAWQIGEVHETENFIAFQFTFGEIRSQNFFTILQTNWQNLHKLVFNTEENSAAVFVRAVRCYGSNDLYDFVWLIKPKSLRYWLKSVALRDADDTFIDYFEIGY